MKFSVGYQMTSSHSFMEYLAENRDHIYEMYFSWGDIPNGRHSMLQSNDYLPWQAQQRQIEDLRFISDAGIKLNLLLNANCYGSDSQSRSFFCKIGDTIDYLKDNFTLASVTTTSPLIAKFIHENFKDIEVRASVNMGIGSIQGMRYLESYFDSFYMKREHNRCLSKIKELKNWCDSEGKGLYLLANSGCLNDCSAHTFHDNLVAHEADIAKMDNAYEFRGICHDYLRDPKNRVSVLRDTNFIRPEDICLYDEYFTAAKLATRVSRNPINTVKAYIRGHYSGSVNDILEPNHSGVLYPYIIENSKIPTDFTRHVMSCDKNCSNCDYCAHAAEAAKVDLGCIEI